MPNHSSEHLLFWWMVLRIVMWHLLLGDLGQSEKPFEINSPLSRIQVNCQILSNFVTFLENLTLTMCINSSQDYAKKITKLMENLFKSTQVENFAPPWEKLLSRSCFQCSKKTQEDENKLDCLMDTLFWLIDKMNWPGLTHRLPTVCVFLKSSE